MVKYPIKKAHDKGVKIVISTGRMFSGAYFFSNILGVNASIIASNGAYIKGNGRDEVMNKGVSKGKAVEFIAKFYNIDRSEIICIGDNGNDVSMIEYAGLGIAMGNGTNIIKNKADFVTVSNENDGVAYAIEKFILN